MRAHLETRPAELVCWGGRHLHGLHVGCTWEVNDYDQTDMQGQVQHDEDNGMMQDTASTCTYGAKYFSHKLLRHRLWHYYSTKHYALVE